MVRSGYKVLRFAVIAVILIVAIYKLSTHRVDLSSYVASKSQDNNQHQQSQKNHQEHRVEEQIVSAPKKDQSYSSSGDYVKANATFVTLSRNEDLNSVVESIREVEDRFNHQFHYDWVFLNDKPFDDNFKQVTTRLISGNTHYDVIPKDHWGFPEWIDQERAALVREEMRQKQVIYGDSIPYRHMCRFESGFFWRHPALDNYKYYWRVEPGIKLYCDIDYDLFKYMEDHKKTYGFVISLYEYIETIPTLWDTTKKFMKEYPQFLNPNSMMDFISDDGGNTYNKCHFWSNFEIASLDFWRGEAYTKYFEFLDQAGGFFYERWGDAPVHSIAANLFLDKDEVHYFDDVGYWHNPFSNCPTDEAVRDKKKCTCMPDDNFTWKGYSCTSRYYKAKNLDRPKGWHEQT